MGTARFQTVITEHLSAPEAAIVLAALRHDLMAWQELEQGQWFDRLTGEQRSRVGGWSLANLSCAALNLTISAEDLLAAGGRALDADILQHALFVYGELITTGKAPVNLANAGLVALALREHFHVSGSWENVLDVPSLVFASSNMDQERLLRTALACLAGMVSDAEGMLYTLAVTMPATLGARWACHAFLSNPQTTSDRLNSMFALVGKLTLEQQVEWLRELRATGEEHLSAQLAQLLVTSEAWSSGNLLKPVAFENSTMAELLERMIRLQQSALIYQCAGYLHQANTLIASARAVARYALAGVETQAMGVEGDSANCSVEMLQLVMESPVLAAEIVPYSTLNELDALLQEYPAEAGLPPLLQLRRAELLAEQGEPELAHQVALSAVDGLVKLLADNRMAAMLPVQTWNPRSTLEVLLKMGLVKDAARVAQVALSARPADSALISQASMIYARLGELEQAVDLAELRVSLQPEDEDGLRSLAGLYEQMAEWEDALRVYERLFFQQPDLPMADILRIARVALQAGSLERAMQLCRLALDLNPDEGIAHTLLGQIYLAKGDRELAYEHLNRATLLDPEQPVSWLMLAAIQKEDGHAREAVDTLRAAVLAVPCSAEIHFALAQSSLENHLPSEALPDLREAYRLNPASAEIAQTYADVLRVLGHGSESRQVVNEARQKFPAYAGLAALDGLMLMDAGDLEAAALAFEIALDSPEPRPEWYLFYARALLHDVRVGQMIGSRVDSARLEKAHGALQQAVTLLSHNFAARVLLAEVLRAEQQVEEAYQLYCGLVDQPEAAQAEWRWRVQAGFGQVALALNEVDTAVIALREAAQANPDDAGLHLLLAEAYWKASLQQEAEQTARLALLLAPDHIETLDWFISFMTRIGKESETYEACQTAVQIAPETIRYWNLLARLQQKRGDVQSARTSLSRLLEIADPLVEDLRSAASTYIQLNELETALSCLERALALSKELNIDLSVEVAELRHRLGHPQAALEVLQQAEEASPSSVELKILEADVLYGLGRPHEAIASLEKALQVQGNCAELAFSAENLAGAWLMSACHPGAVFERLTAIHYQNGALLVALQYAEAGLEAEPENLALRAVAVELSRSMLMMDKAGRLVEEAPVFDVPDRLALWQSYFNTVLVEMALDSGEDAHAAGLMEKNGQDMTDDPRRLSIRARLLARMGDLTGAQDALLAAKSCAAQPVENQPVTPAPVLATIYWEGSVLSIAEAALDLCRWDEAQQKFEQYTGEHANKPRAHVRHAAALVVMAEQQRVSDALCCQTHAPGEDKLGEQYQLKFNQAMRSAEQMSQSSEIGVWKVRGKAVYFPSLQNAPALAKLPPTAENAAALLAVMRLSKNSGNAVRIIHHYPENPEMLVQVALCYSEVDPHQGVVAAQKAVERDPHRPLSHAALALLHEKAGDPVAAIQSLENALAYWPDEPRWHAWVADLSEQSGDLPRAIQHWEKALALVPGDCEYALILSQLYLEQGNYIRGIEVLEQSSQLNPRQKSVWIALAHAYGQVGKLEEAMDCAELAYQIDPADVSPLLLSGEIALYMGKPDLALEYARKAEIISSRQENVVLFLSRVLVQKGQLAEGLTVLEQALPVLHGSLPVLLERASLVRRLYGPQVAMPVYQELSQIFPQDAGILSELAHVQADCGDLKTAERTAYAAHHLNPQLPQINFLLGRLQHIAGQLDQAIHFLSEVVRLAPAELEAYLELGQAYLDRRESDQAMKTYQQAIKIAPRDYRPYYRAALVLRDEKDYVAAEVMLRRAAEYAPEDLNIRRQLGAVVALNLVHNSQEVNSIL